MKKLTKEDIKKRIVLKTRVYRHDGRTWELEDTPFDNEMFSWNGDGRELILENVNLNGFYDFFIDFSDIDNINFKTDCSMSEIKLGNNSKFYCNNVCYVECGNDCDIFVNQHSYVKSGDRCKIKAGYNSIVVVDNSCCVTLKCKYVGTFDSNVKVMGENNKITLMNPKLKSINQEVYCLENACSYSLYVFRNLNNYHISKVEDFNEIEPFINERNKIKYDRIARIPFLVNFKTQTLLK